MTAHQAAALLRMYSRAENAVSLYRWVRPACNVYDRPYTRIRSPRVSGSEGWDSNAMVTDLRRARGDETRGKILQQASEVASVEGLNGLSMANLADALQLSKSGVHALFGTKEDLQLATVAAARHRFIQVVVTPVYDEAEGLPRLKALVASWLEYVRRREFPGGCFVTRWSAEFASHPGRVRDALGTARTQWLQLIATQLSAAKDRGELAGSVDPEQLAFEIDGMLVAGNNGILIGDETALERAARAVAGTIAIAQGRSGASAGDGADTTRG